MNRTDDGHDPDDLDAETVLEQKTALASSVASAPAMTENSIPQDDELVLEDTVDIGDFRIEEEDFVVPQDDSKSAEVEANCEVSIRSDIWEQEQDSHGHAAPFQELVALEELFSPLEYSDDRTSPLDIAKQGREGGAEVVQALSGSDLDMPASSRWQIHLLNPQQDDRQLPVADSSLEPTTNRGRQPVCSASDRGDGSPTRKP